MRVASGATRRVGVTCRTTTVDDGWSVSVVLSCCRGVGRSSMGRRSVVGRSSVGRRSVVGRAPRGASCCKISTYWKLGVQEGTNYIWRGVRGDSRLLMEIAI